MNEPAPSPRLSGSRAKTALVVVLGIAVVVVRVGIQYVGMGFQGGYQGGTTTIVITLCLFAVVALLVVANHAEHGLRMHTPVAQTYVAPGDDPPAIARRAGLLGRTYSPLASGASMIAFVALAVLLGLVANASHSKAQRSAYVQEHGVEMAATIVGVDNTERCFHNGGCTRTAKIPVTLPSRVDGVTKSVVYYPGRSTLNSGERVRVLIDPKQATYAELPGHYYMTTARWIIWLAMALACCGLAAFYAFALLRLLAHRRSQGQRVTAPGLTPGVGLS
jgi:hypothetical protein